MRDHIGTAKDLGVGGDFPLQRRGTGGRELGARMAQGANDNGPSDEPIDPLLRQGVEDGFEGDGIGDPQLSEGIDEFGLNALDLGLS
ncbi:hypothetical protein ACVWXO_004928 [Bradyrhizobium sp. LM2.7]